MARSVPNLAATLALLGAAGSLAGCGPELERASEVTSLRVLAVKKDKPYAQPGETVELQMLWEDALDGEPRETQIFWVADCDNPPGDLYAACFQQWAQLGRLPTLGSGPVFSAAAPPLRAEVPEGQPDSGVGFVYFGICAGRLDLEEYQARLMAGAIEDFSQAFPLCLDEEGNPQGSESYIIGYSALYTYADPDFTNANPVVTGFQVNKQDAPVDCIGDACVGNPFPVPELDGCVEGVPCIDACEDDGDPSCPEVEIQPLIDRLATVQPDVIADEVFGRSLEESLWINYLVDRGSVKSDVRLLNDATTGWNDDFGTSLYAPREPGPLRIWAVVHDNRGGVEWVRVPAYVR